ncbi:hypothetical protein E7T06_09360 [Deinococcus sp. Arct2-2]|uniref:TniQ family protein n=1 Tax=Deinococcus sp. Arct2-2 TaxID=2568653 RepID=UPI0010A365AB|nr:TniQ family protein [Deinococcus sp. Arct2-2]THF69956.1 hypothetical protein E7T06_09360 [Deinococcus sp. Arct2-2]
MTPGRRQFNYAPRPKPGQSFTSYIETFAAEHLPPLDILTMLYRTGVIEEDHFRALPIGYGLTLTDKQVQDFAFVLRLPEERVRAMLLTHYDGIAFSLQPMDVTTPKAYAGAVRSNSNLFTTTRLCPCCMAEDPYFRLAHRLPWLFLCSTHQVLLQHLCPQCARPFGNFLKSRGGMPTYPANVPDPSCCRNPPPRGEGDSGRNARSCGQPLAEVTAYDVSGYPRVLATQGLLEEVLERGEGTVCGERVSSVSYFGHLRSVLSLLDYAADPEDLGPGLPPRVLETAGQHVTERGSADDEGSIRRQRATTAYRTPEWMCAFLPKAVELLAQPDEIALTETLEPLLNQARRFKRLHFRTLGHYFKFEGPVLRAFDTALMPTASPRRRAGYTSPHSHHPDRPYRYRPEHVPQLLWEETYRTNFAGFFGESGMGERHLRSFVAMDLVRLCGDFGWIEAANELGFLPGQARGSANKAIGVLNSLGQYETYLTRLHATAATLESVGRPFDFGRRRQRYADLMDFPFDDWQLDMRALELHPGKPGGKNRWAAAHAWALLTAGHPRRAPVFQRLAYPAYENSLEVFYRFNRDHLVQLLPLIRTLSLTLTADQLLAAEIAFGAQENPLSIPREEQQP